jgi:hypothetical protein
MRVVGLALAIPSVLLAQGERITIRTLPTPGLASRMTIGQEMHFDIAGPALPSPMAMVGNTRMLFIQRNGAPDSLGITASQLVYDTLTMSLTINGAAMGVPLDEVVGKPITLKYDPTGSLVDLRVPSDLDRFAPQLRQMLGSAMNALPTGPLAPGDSASASQKVPLPFDMGGTGGEAPVFEIVSRYVLQRITQQDGEVVAILDQVSQGILDRPVSMPGIGPAQVSLRMNGTGTVEVFTRTGVVRAATNDSRLEMSMDLGGGGTMTVTGTIRTLVSGSMLP